MRLLACLFLALAASAFAADASAPVNQVLDDWHKAAALADENRYFSYFTPDGVFLGTDGAERWTTSEFRKWAKPRFDRKKAWNFHPHDRHVSFSPDGRIAWFDEALDTPNLGPSRGTGVLVKTPAGWKIAQYNLSIPIPNDLADGIVRQIAKAAPTR